MPSFLGPELLPQAEPWRVPTGLTPGGVVLLAQGRPTSPSLPSSALALQTRECGCGHREAQAEAATRPVLMTPPPTPPPPGRTSFYEEHASSATSQNHLTEVLTLVAMELPVNTSSPEAVLQHKLQAFQALRASQRHSACAGPVPGLQRAGAQGAAEARQLPQPDADSFAGGSPGPGTGCWAAPARPQVEAVLPPQTPSGWAREGLEVGFARC